MNGAPKGSAAPTTLRERANWNIHIKYCRQDYTECLQLIEQQLAECSGLCEYPIYVKGAQQVYLGPG
jgi:Bardet-Biedl syndrome 4 protein